MKIAFVWFGLDGRYGVWRDGLYAAMKLIEEKHQVRYYDTHRLDELKEWSPDIVLFWEAPCTVGGKDAEMYRSVQALPFKKMLLFAGGPMRADWVEGFDLVFVESQINEEECAAQGIPYWRAFGVNTSIFKPEKQPKLFNGYMQATYALWKRHRLFAEALGEGGIATGRKQAHEPQCYEECERYGVLTLDEVPAQVVSSLINASHCVVNTAEHWGGGQRCTLEAMACGVPVIVMSDSPKNIEFVKESGGGLIIEPDARKISDAIIYQIKNENGLKMGQAAFEYVQSTWTEHHYRDALLAGINAYL